MKLTNQMIKLHIDKVIVLICILIMSFWQVVYASEANQFHPVFKLEGGSNYDIEKSCSQCHDINNHGGRNTHSLDKLKITCLDCHSSTKTITYDSQFITKKEFTETLRIPDSQQCLHCHSEQIADTQTGLHLNPNDNSKGAMRWRHHLMLAQGSFYSSQKIAESFLNNENKYSGVPVWDVHAQRQLQCTSCHYSANNPARNHLSDTSLSHLKFDVREELPTHLYLQSPSHQLNQSECTSCHQTQTTHLSFPYRQRHLDAVSCQSCHIPEVSGPVLKLVDESIFTESGHPLFDFWNTKFENGLQYKSNESPFAQLNTQLIHRQNPLLLVNKHKIQPYNLITHRRWILSGNSNPNAKNERPKRLSPEQFTQLFWNNEKSKLQLMQILDQNQDQKISQSEWLTTSQKRDEFVLSILKVNGYKEAHLEAKNIFQPIGHGVLPAKYALQKCSVCHGNDSLFDQQAQYFTLAKIEDFNTTNQQKNLNNDKNKNFEDPTPPQIDKYVLGTSRIRWIDFAGWFGLAFLVLVITVHGFMRWRFSLKIPQSATPHLKKVKVYIYGRYERFWHWLLALSTTGLLVTGLEIHYPDSFSIFGFRNAILLHNASAFLFILNSFLSLFYHITNSKIKMFIPKKEGLWLQIKEQLIYYGHGIFYGIKHTEKSRDHKLNPLQQMTYLALLNILLPIQVITGVLMWAVDKSTTVSQLIDGYSYLGPIHTAGSWLFFLFLVLHIYLTTTGETPLAHIKSMITGEEHNYGGKE